jgi:hypothetical protein
MSFNYIHTLGDSTLDNFFWMLHTSSLDPQKAKETSVEGILEKQGLKDGYRFVGHAYDGFTTRSVLEGDRIGEVLPNGEEKALYMREKASQRIRIRPLHELQKSISSSPSSVHYVVISVGGNDFRVNFRNPWRLLKDIPQIQKRYSQILEKVQKLPGRDIRPILMLQYRPDANNDPYRIYPLFKVIGIIAVAVHIVCLAILTAPLWALAGMISALAGACTFFSGAVIFYLSLKIIPFSVTKDVFLGREVGMAALGGLMQTFYRPILKRAKHDRLPVLDLANTFHPRKKIYACGIEPGKKGGQLIAEGIQHIVKHHDFSKESSLYSKSLSQANYTKKPNTSPASWQVIYPANF